jgi:hypothetical protein
MAAGKMNYGEPIIFPDDNLKEAKKTKFRGIKEVGDASILSVFPNPAQDYFILKVNLIGFIVEGLINLYDANGKIVQSSTFTGKQNQIIIPTSKLNSGLYILILYINDNLSYSTKLSIVK